MHPKLKPLFADLKEAGLQHYLTTTDFQRLAIEHNFEGLWDVRLKKVKLDRNYFGMGHDHEPDDCFEAFIILINDFYKESHYSHDDFLSDKKANEILFQTLSGFCRWTKVWFDLNSIFQDLTLAGFKHIDFSYLSEYKIPARKRAKNKTLLSEKLHTNDKPRKAQIRLLLLSEGKIETLIEELTDELIKGNAENDSESQKNLINISSRWHRSNEFRRFGTISLDDFHLEMNKINDALRDLIQKLK